MSEPRAFGSGGNLGRKLCTFHPQIGPTTGCFLTWKCTHETQMGPPCFDWSWLFCLGGLIFKNRCQLGSRHMYIHIYIYMQDVHVHGMEQRHSNMCLKNNQTHNDLWNDKKVCGHWSIGNHNNKLQINFIVAEWNKNGTRTCLRYQYQASSTRKQGVSNSHESDKKLPMTGSK